MVIVVNVYGRSCIIIPRGLLYLWQLQSRLTADGDHNDDNDINDTYDTLTNDNNDDEMMTMTRMTTAMNNTTMMTTKTITISMTIFSSDIQI